MAGKLYLIPTPISPENIDWVLPAAVQHCIAELSYFIAEHPKTARQFLKQLNCKQPLQALHMQPLNEHTAAKDLPVLLEPILAGQDGGLLSEAGCPAVADPGAELVRLAHKNHITVVPLVGPSSIVLALMASGLNGQRFAFHGYLPVESAACASKIAELEKQSISLRQTQIFIEAPYRNQKLLEQLVAVCRDSTDLCIASHLTFFSEMVMTKPIKEWRHSLPDINRIPAIFLLQG
ncbi:MAG: SAM-dependent methyltransferase [Proteobacteria bacterium]|nr:SAM-dependent methyltransferase [Pseudomonadota bacterium]